VPLQFVLELLAGLFVVWDGLGGEGGWGSGVGGGVGGGFLKQLE
jgi:hypothetical protein